ncbi:MAG: sensor histidine kinase [Ignavibacteriota bacterium]|nr:sensor histidine kinase [Ignavibacteriota bacterium]MBW7842399.1 sensor histidine kinase [Ignavibacterium sp.]MCO6447819.1 sensor histidine kinase [Ignavibacterium album]MCZ2269249.1 sensor histidine kinase [Ignavibacteriales bacterium]HOJ06585.1 sensor histidine kinase [Ignavibacteriaceae bacterium]
MLLLIQNSSEFDDYIKSFPSSYNPVFISILIFILILALIYISYKNIYIPMIKKHKKDKKQFEITTEKILSMFSELDPNPIIRIAQDGLIINLNESAKNRFNYLRINESYISSIISGIDLQIADIINNDKSFILPMEINDRYYDVNFHGISFLGMAQLYFWDTTEQKEYDRQMTNYQNLLRNSSAHLQKVIEEERNRLSRILHDSIAQNLLLIKLNVNNYKKFLNSGLVEEEYYRTINILDSTLKDVRELAHNLKPLNIEELGLETVVRSMCNNVAREGKYKYQLQFPEQPLHLPKDIEICVFRVIQESLNNMIRHAKATSFTINLFFEETALVLFISDDGIGFKPKKLLNEKYISDGLGMMNMQESVEKLKGSFQVDSSNNSGTIIIAAFPIEVLTANEN